MKFQVDILWSLPVPCSNLRGFTSVDCSFSNQNSVLQITNHFFFNICALHRCNFFYKNFWNYFRPNQTHECISILSPVQGLQATARWSIDRPPLALGPPQSPPAPTGWEPLGTEAHCWQPVRWGHPAAPGHNACWAAASSDLHWPLE